MRELMSSFLSNDSPFGRLMTRCGVIIGANLMFVLFSMPLVTVGASFAALYHVMFKTLRGDGELNPFRTFWEGFRSNFKQATLVWIAAIALFLFGAADLRIIAAAGASGSASGSSALAFLRYPILAMGICALILVLYLFPTMAAFADTIPHLLRSSLYFAMHRPWKIPVIVFFDVFPLYLTYTDPQMMPLYAFLWCFFGFGAIAMLGAVLLLPDMAPFLDQGREDLSEEASDEPDIADAPGESEAEDVQRALDDMQKLGM